MSANKDRDDDKDRKNLSKKEILEKVAKAKGLGTKKEMASKRPRGVHGGVMGLSIRKSPPIDEDG